MFFSFDGLDGAGKTTQREMFCQWLRQRGMEVVECRDPGSTALGDILRDLLLRERPDLAISRPAEMLLFMAARAQLVEEVIRPALAAGKTVVSDRYLLANVVYQGHAGGLDVEALWRVGAVATAGVVPDVTFVLDLPPDTARGRIGRPPDRMETQGEDFNSRLRQGYLSEAARRKDVIIIDASPSIDEVQAALRAEAEKILGNKP